MSRYNDLKVMHEMVKAASDLGQWKRHAQCCVALKKIKARAWCRGCGEYQGECSCDKRQEVRR